jgi:hypothetical protein
MMRRFKSWLINIFLPAWAKDSIYRENEALRLEVSDLRAKLREREAFIEGLERGVRAQRRIVINNEVKK